MIFDLRNFWRCRRAVFGFMGVLLTGLLYTAADQALEKGAMAIAGTRTEQKVVALTFDHSWGNTFTPAILDTLKAKNVHATFFIMGPWAAKYPEVAKRIAAEGHEIGSHGYRHQNYGDMTPGWVKEDIQKAHAQIEAATGVQASLLRPPNGHYNQASLNATAELGYKTIIWNIDSLDWKNPGKDAIIERVVKRLQPGGIILLHASDTPQQTAEALPELLARIEGAGYRIVTVGELFSQYAEQGLRRH